MAPPADHPEPPDDHGSPPPEHTTRLLARLSAGDASVADELLGRIYAELRALAVGHMQRQSPSHTLQPTALVHEAYLRLIDQPGASYASQGHFYALASRVMRTVLVDHARERKAEKRGGDRLRVPLEGCAAEAGDAADDPAAADAHDLMDVDEALKALAQVDAELVEVVELRHFGGLTTPKAAEVLGVSERTVERRLRAATAWLQRRLS